MNDLYKSLKDRITNRLQEFEELWSNGDNKHAFTELAFCIFTPQSSAKACWDAILRLKEKGLLFKGRPEELVPEMKRVRFSRKKSEFLVLARENFYNSFNLKDKIESFSDSYQRREWLVKNVKGYGYKEASHFLRNVGFAENLAILDRHILKNLVKNKVIDEVPKSMTKSVYLGIEKKMQQFALEQDIRMDHLDLLFWYMEAKDIFK